MSEDDIKQLLAPPDQRAALLAALRRQQGFGNLGMLTGDRVLAPFGAAQVRQAQVGADNALRAAAISAGNAQAREVRAEERQLAREARKADADKQKSVLDIEERRRNVLSALDGLEKQVQESGTFDLTGPANSTMEALVTNYAIDMAKLKDPTSVAREGEVEMEKKALFTPGVKGLATSNATALELIRRAKERAIQRKAEAYRVRGLEAPGAAAPGSPKSIRVTNGKEVLEIAPEDLDDAKADGYRVVP